MARHHRDPGEALLATETFAANGWWIKPMGRSNAVTFCDDGVVAAEIDNPVPYTCTWRLQQNERDRIAVEIDDPWSEDGVVRRVFDVIDADHLTFRQNQTEYRMVRVKDAK